MTDFLIQAALSFFVLGLTAQTVTTFMGFLLVRRHRARRAADPELPSLDRHALPVTIICPLHNESGGAVATLDSILALRYPEFQVIAVNDGSTDDTLDHLFATYRLVPSRRVARDILPGRPIRQVLESPAFPRLLVLDKGNGGKADALNAGLNFADHPLVCSVDGDSILARNALTCLTRPFLEEPEVVAVGGVIRSRNGLAGPVDGARTSLPSNWLARFQVLEYLRAFLYGRLGLAALDLLFILSGAFALFRKDVLLDIGGFQVGTVGEDLEIVVRIHRHLRTRGRPYRVRMVPDPICWTEMPEDLGSLARQRDRWHRGLLETLFHHRAMLFSPRFGRIGLLSLPHLLLFEALAPLFELAGFLQLLFALWKGALAPATAFLFFTAALFLAMINSILAILLEQGAPQGYCGLRIHLQLAALAVAEQLGYRQLTFLFRLGGIVSWLRHKRSWGQVRRLAPGPAK